MKKFVFLDILELKLEIKDLFKLILSCYRSKDCIMINNIIDIFIFIDIINFIIIIIESNNFIYNKKIIDIRVIFIIFNIDIEIHVIYNIIQDI